MDPCGVGIVQIFAQDSVAIKIFLVFFIENLAHSYEDLVMFDKMHAIIFWHLANN